MFTSDSDVNTWGRNYGVKESLSRPYNQQIIELVTNLNFSDPRPCVWIPVSAVPLTIWIILEKSLNFTQSKAPDLKKRSGCHLLWLCNQEGWGEDHGWKTLASTSHTWGTGVSSEWGPTSHFNTIFGPFRSVIYAIVIRTIWVKSKAYETVISNCSGKSFICLPNL